jgi:addiction module HigA family antidote
MPNKIKTSAEALQSFIDKYQISVLSLSKNIKLNYKTVLDILKGEARITVPTALKLSKYFNITPEYWLDIQTQSEIDKFSRDKKFLSVLKNIPKVEIQKTKVKVKPVKNKSKSKNRKARLS